MKFKTEPEPEQIDQDQTPIRMNMMALEMSQYRNGFVICSVKICGQQFLSMNQFIDHMQQEHNPSTIYRCHFPNCDSISIYRSNMKRHLRTAHEKIPVEMLRRSLRRAPLVENIVNNPISTKNGEANGRKMSERLKAKSSPKPQTPSSVLENKTNTICSNQLQSPIVQMVRRCSTPGCHYSSRSAKNLTKHEKSHSQLKTPNSDLRCSVPDCRYATCSPKLLKTHMKLCIERQNYLKTGSKPFGCSSPGCQYSTYSSSALSKHQRLCPLKSVSVQIPKSTPVKSPIVSVDAKIDQATYECDSYWCQFSCNSIGKLKIHQREAHLSVRYSCKVKGCKQQFKLWGSFKLHMTSSHPHLIINH